MTVALDLELIPLTVIFKGFVEAVDSTIFSMTFFQFAMDPIRKNIFTLTTKSKDKSPPVFSGPCKVEQAVDHPITAPGVMLSFSAKDPDTKVEKAYVFIGTTLGGSDIMKETAVDLSLKETFQPLSVPAAKAVFINVKACNIDEYCSTTACQLPSWDLDATRFDGTQVHFSLLVILAFRAIFQKFLFSHLITRQAYDFQSHPTQVEATFSAEDESAIVPGTLQWAYGSSVVTAEKVNDTSAGSDISPWQPVAVPPASTTGTLAHRISGVKATISLGFNLVHNQVYFLNMKAQNRLGFWGAGASRGVLIDLIPPFPSASIDFDRCSPEWFEFFNRTDVMNNLAPQGKYNAGVLGCEFMRDEVRAEGCRHTTILDWHKKDLSDRCVGPTPLPNHHYIVDSGTVFNGHKLNEHQLYQYAQTTFTITWYVSDFIVLIELLFVTLFVLIRQERIHGRRNWHLQICLGRWHDTLCVQHAAVGRPLCGHAAVRLEVWRQHGGDSPAA